MQTESAVPVSRFFSASRSVLRISLLVGLLGLYPASFGYALLLFVDAPGERLICAIFFTIISFWMANAFAQKVVQFGQEIRIFLLAEPCRFWPLAFRVYGFRLFMLLILAPLLATATFAGREIANPTTLRLWLFGINMILLNALLVMLSVSLTFIPQPLRSLRYGINALFPVTLMRLPGFNTAFTVTLIGLYVGRAIWPYLGTAVMQGFTSFAQWLDQISQRMPLGGRLITYWVSPHYAFIKQARLENSTWVELLAFAIATSVLLLALALLTHGWIARDMHVVYRETYLAHYQFMEAYFRELDEKASERLAEEAREPDRDFTSGKNDDPRKVDEREMESELFRSRAAPTRLSQVIGSETAAYQQTPVVFTLPSEKPAETFVIEMWPMPKVWPQKGWWIVFGIAAVIISGYYRNFAPVLPALWVVASAVKKVPQNLSASITAQNIWTRQRWLFRKYMLPLLPADFAAALVVPLISSHDWWYILPSTLALFLVRPFLMIFNAIYHMQAAWSMLVMFICGAGVLWSSLAPFFTQLSGDPPIGPVFGAIMCGFVLAPHLLAWLWFTILVTWKYDNLLYRDPRAR